MAKKRSNFKIYVYGVNGSLYVEGRISGIVRALIREDDRMCIKHRTCKDCGGIYNIIEVYCTEKRLERIKNTLEQYYRGTCRFEKSID